jgi:hypothetical protein
MDRSGLMKGPGLFFQFFSGSLYFIYKKRKFLSANAKLTLFHINSFIQNAKLTLIIFSICLL